MKRVVIISIVIVVLKILFSISFNYYTNLINFSPFFKFCKLMSNILKYYKFFTKLWNLYQKKKTHIIRLFFDKIICLFIKGLKLNR